MLSDALFRTTSNSIAPANIWTLYDPCKDSLNLCSKCCIDLCIATSQALVSYLIQRLLGSCSNHIQQGCPDCGVELMQDS